MDEQEKSGSHKQPLEPEKFGKLSWYDRLLEWDGWETLYERRGQALSALALLLLCVGLISWFITKRESSSLSTIIQAETLVAELRGNAPADKKTISHEQDLQQLEAIVPAKGQLADRFSGVIAQEQIIEGTPKLSEDRFAIASDVLTEASLPLQSLVVKTTELTAQKKWTEALATIETIIEKSNTEKNLGTYTYALLQKATILKSLGQPNDLIIKEIERVVSESQDAEKFFELWCADDANKMLDFLKKPEKKS